LVATEYREIPLRSFNQSLSHLTKMRDLSRSMLAEHADHGKYSADLKALAPAYLKEIPTDLFTAGNPLSYKVTGKTYLLYSVGPDGKDDGGTASADGKDGASGASTKSLNIDSMGDIVAGVNIR